MEKMRARGVPLNEFVGAKPYRGVLTGLNEAFLIDDATRLALIRDDPGCADIIKPYLRGQDIKRWTPDWQGLWMIVLKSSGNHAWSWSESGAEAEAVFQRSYPSLHAHLKPLQDRLMARQDKGRFWWELRSCDYYEAFSTPKIIHTDIAWRPQFAYSEGPMYFVNTCYVWPVTDLFVLAVMNSPLLWAYMWRNAQHGKDEALRLIHSFMTTLPIAEPTAEARTQAEAGVTQLIELSRESQQKSGELLDWLRVEFALDAPGQRLEAYVRLTGDEFVAEVRKRRPKGAPRLTPKAIAELAETHRHYADAERHRAASVQKLERELSAIVNRCYGLTDAEIDLLWRTAPPRMPHSGS
jgi:hypothetical protein